ncbi:MAG TPA: ABC transporter ATP-binding protein [Rhodopila sp.]
MTPDTASDTVLQARGLNVQYGTSSLFGRRPFHAVRDVSLQLGRGEILAVIGESGSGKTSMLRAMAGLVPASGSVMIEGREMIGQSGRALRALRGRVGLMFQDPVGSLSPRLTVRHAVTEPFRIHGVKDRDLDAECARLLRMVGLPADFAGRYPHQLSGGQARRVGVARALALDPSVILADEPTAGLDVSVQGELLNLLRGLQDRLGISMLIITHNLHVVRHIADRIAIALDGEIVEQGDNGRILTAPEHPFTRALLAANLHVAR